MNLKISLLLVCISLSIILFSQPVFNSDVFGAVGDIYTMKGIETSSFEPGAGGADATWDFTSITYTGGTEIRKIVDATTSEYADMFPDANIAVVIDDTSFTYYNLSSALLTLHGSATPTLQQAFDDPADLVDFPVTYNDIKSDDFNGSSVILGYDVSLNGTTQTNADGYGILKLISGDHTDALRIKINIDLEGTVSGFPIGATVNTTIYYWFLEGIVGPALQYTLIDTDIFGSLSTSEYADINEALISGIENNNQIHITIQPNPAENYISISPAHQAWVSIYNLTGEKIMEQFITNSSTQIDVSELIAGNYIVYCNTENGAGSEMITITK